MEHTLDLDALRDQIVNECMRRIGEKQPAAETVNTETEEKAEERSESASAESASAESADASSETKEDSSAEEVKEDEAQVKTEQPVEEAKEDSSAEEVIKAEALNSAAETAPTITHAMKAMDEWRELKGEDLMRWCRRHPDAV